MERQKYYVGDIVRINESFQDQPKGILAFVYEEYNTIRTGISLITEKGTDLGGFSESEQDEYLTFVKKTGLLYKHINFYQLKKDFASTILLVFEPGFTLTREIPDIKGSGKSFTKYLEKMGLKYFGGENCRVDWEANIIIASMDWNDEDNPFYVMPLDEFIEQLKPKKKNGR